MGLSWCLLCGFRPGSFYPEQWANSSGKTFKFLPYFTTISARLRSCLGVSDTRTLTLTLTETFRRLTETILKSHCNCIEGVAMTCKYKFWCPFILNLIDVFLACFLELFFGVLNIGSLSCICKHYMFLSDFVESPPARVFVIMVYFGLFRPGFVFSLHFFQGGSDCVVWLALLILRKNQSNFLSQKMLLVYWVILLQPDNGRLSPFWFVGAFFVKIRRRYGHIFLHKPLIDSS